MRQSPILIKGMYHCPVCNKQLKFASNDVTNSEYLRCPVDYNHCSTVSMSNPDTKGYAHFSEGAYNSALSDLHDKFYGEDD